MFYLPAIKPGFHSIFFLRVGCVILLIVPVFDIHIRSSNLRILPIYSRDCIQFICWMRLTDDHNSTEYTKLSPDTTKTRITIKSHFICGIMNFMYGQMAKSLFYNRSILQWLISEMLHCTYANWLSGWPKYTFVLCAQLGCEKQDFQIQIKKYASFSDSRDGMC